MRPIGDGDDFVFVIRSDVFHVYFVRGTGAAQAVGEPIRAENISLVPSRTRDAVFVLTTLADNTQELSIWDTTGSRRVERPAIKNADIYPLGDNDRVQLYANLDNRNAYLEVDFATAQAKIIPNLKPPTPDFEKFPFLLDAYATERESRDIFVSTPDTLDLIEGKAPLPREEGGFRVDIVDREGSVRRRLPFLPDCGRGILVSTNGLSFAFRSHGWIMVRSLVRTDRTTTERFLKTEKAILSEESKAEGRK